MIFMGEITFALSYQGKVIDICGNNITAIKVLGGHPFKAGDQVDLTYKAGVLPMSMGIYEVTMVQGNTFNCRSKKIIMEPRKGMNIQIDLYKRAFKWKKFKKSGRTQPNDLNVGGSRHSLDRFADMNKSSSFSVLSPKTPRVIHAFVALCDNKHQSIVPVPAKLGNGDDPKNNLYWGARYGVKTFFKNSSNWKLIKILQASEPVLERCVFKHNKKNVYFISDAYRGSHIRKAIIDFLDAASGSVKHIISLKTKFLNTNLNISGSSHLIVYVGHNGLMDFKLNNYPEKKDNKLRETIILACLSKSYFYDPIIRAGAKPLLWTTGLMAPEAYILENAFEGWIKKESEEYIRLRAAKAYNYYQKCGLKAAKRLLVTGFNL
jgi:hypothetical protein